MGKKRIYRKEAAVFLAAAYMAGSMAHTSVSAYAAEQGTAAGAGIVQEQQGITGRLSADSSELGYAANTEAALAAELEQDGGNAGSGTDGTESGEDNAGKNTEIDRNGDANEESAGTDGIGDTAGEDTEAEETGDAAGEDTEAEETGDKAGEDAAAGDIGEENTKADGEGGTGAGGTEKTDSDTGENADGSYTDGSGVTYSYHVASDGTAEIYAVKGHGGKNMDIPAEIDGHTVERITFSVAHGPDIESLTIPETVTYIGENAFGWTAIGTLNYNAAAASAVEMTKTGAFSCAKIGNFAAGAGVRSIPARMFRNTVFQQEELVVTADIIGESAFRSAEFRKLVIGAGVGDIAVHAFAYAKIGELSYNAKDACCGDGQMGSAPFSDASISGFSIGESAVSIPPYLFANARISMPELSFPDSTASIGQCAFYDALAAGSTLETLSIGKNITYLGGSAFHGCSTELLDYNAVSPETDGTLGNGPFNGMQAGSLCIGENAVSLPTKIFCGMGLEQDELTISGNVTFIGEKVLCSGEKELSIGTLSIGEGITYIGFFAFAGCSIGTLNYNAVAAETGRTNDDPFHGAEAGELCIGEDVGELPAGIFAGMALSQDTLDIPSGMASIGDRAFYAAGQKAVSIGTLTIPENVSYIGRGAFGSCSIGKAAVYANGEDGNCGAAEMAERELPECGSVEIHGGSGFYSYFTAKTAPENIVLLCSRFETSHGEEYFDAEKNSFVTPSVDTCMECGYQKMGGEYADAHIVTFFDYDGTELSKQAVHTGQDAAGPDVPQREGWRFTGWDREFTGITSDMTVTAQYEVQKFTVTFMDGSMVLDTQEVEYGNAAAAPAEPVKEPDGKYIYKFAGWDSDYSFVTKNMIIYALFDAVESGNGTDKDKDKGESGNGEAKDKEESGNGTDNGRDESGNEEDKGKNESGNGEAKDKEESGSGADKDTNKDMNKAESGNGADKEADKGESVNSADKDKEESGNGTDTDKDKSDNNKGASGGSRDKSGSSTETAKPSAEPDGQKTAADRNPAAGTGNRTENVPADAAQTLPVKQENGQQKPPVPEEGAGNSAAGKETGTEPLQELAGRETETEPLTKPAAADEGDGKETGEPEGGAFRTSWTVFLFSGIAALAAFLTWLLRSRKRKICGTVLEADGSPAAGAHIIITAGEDFFETLTDRDGYFSFGSLEKGRYTLDISRSGGQEILSMDISMAGRDGGKMFRIRGSHCSRVEPSHKKNRYVVNVTA